MNENESAVRVATTIHGYFNYLEEKVEEGEYNYNEIPPGACISSHDLIKLLVWVIC